MICLTLFLFSCEKDNISNKPDNILFTDLIPDVTISSIDSLVNFGTDPRYRDCYVPYPKDSVAYFILDLNNDKEIDFKVYHSHWYGSEQWSPSFPCSAYDNYLIKIVSDKGEIWTELKSEISPRIVPKQLNIGDKVDNDNMWTKEVIIYVRSSTCQCFYESSSNYIGLRINQNDSIYYGWLHMDFSEHHFTIKEYAVNLTGNNRIIVGQKY